jgi:acyl-CoA thioesterase-1
VLFRPTRHLSPRTDGRLRALLGAVVVAALTGIALTGPVASAPRHAEEMSAGTALRTYVAIGDSITAGMRPTDRLDTPGPTAWVNGETAARLVRVGGWAVPGRTTADMLANARPATADVLVLLGGTNDLAHGFPWEGSAANLRGIAAEVGAASTLLVAIPPNDRDPGARTVFNARLAGLAAQAHWRFLDPWTGVAVDGAWVPGTGVDGIHPTPQVAAAVGRIIADRAWQVAGRRTGR